MTATLVKAVKLKAYAAAGYPDLKRGMLVSVQRPWQWSRPLLSLLSWRIRANSSAIVGQPASESHSMIYIGRGRCASQDSKFEVAHLSSYRGCRLTFFDPPWTREERNALVAEAMVYVGQSYDYIGVIGQLIKAKAKTPKGKALLDVPALWYCSQAVCELVRKAIYSVFCLYRWPRCQLTPQELHDENCRLGWPRVILNIK